MKLTIHHGSNKPFKAIDKNQCNLLDFAFKYPQWHTHSNDKSTLKAILALQSNGHILLNTFGQFKINM